jgi:hypothetical protein
MSGDSWTVEVICTDRGQHKREWLAEFETYQRDDGTVEFRRITARHPKRKHHTFVPAASNAEAGTPVSRKSHSFNCPCCTRWPRIDADRWDEILDGARRAGFEEFDVSYLD